MRSKLLYWLTNSVSTEMSSHITQLEKNNFIVRKVFTFDELRLEFNKSRSAAIVISDDFVQNDLYHGLINLTAQPEFAGVRFILAKTRSDSELAKLVTTLNFKDIIPVDLHPKHLWFQRLEFSIGTRDYVKPPPDYQMTIHSIAAVRAPARMTWINESSLLIETKLNIPIGSRIRLESELNGVTGDRGLQVCIKERKRSNLRYRFSDAYLCDIIGDFGNRMVEYLEKENIDKILPSRPVKIFAAIKNAKLRKKLTSELTPDIFDLTFALQQKSILTEPSYIKPDFLILDLDLAQSPNETFISDLSSKTNQETEIITVGRSEQKNIYFDIKGKMRQRVSFVDKDMQSIVDYINSSPVRSNLNRPTMKVLYLPKQHPLSRMFVRIPARITKLHPDTISITTQYELGRFNLALVESPIFTASFDRSLVVKVTQSFTNSDPQTQEFPYANEAIISDLTGKERMRLSTEILELFENHILQHYNEESATRKIERAITKVNLLAEKSPPVNIKLSADHRLTSKGITKKETNLMPSKATSSSDTLVTPQVKIERQETKPSRRISFERKRKKEHQLLYSILFIVAFIVGVAIVLRDPPENQGKVFSESYRRYYEKTKGVSP